MSVGSRDPAPRGGIRGGRPAPAEHPIHPLIRDRWSPRAIDPRPVEPEKLRTLFEAARWAPSSYNEQPWRFLVATTAEPDWLEALRDYLLPGNAWARRASVLIASAYRAAFSRNGKPNRVAFRDLGAAEENLVLQAYDLGLVAHQMGGFDAERLKAELLPDPFEPGTMIAVGYPGDPGALDGGLQVRERGPRVRRPLDAFVFGREWGEGAGFL